MPKIALTRTVVKRTIISVVVMTTRRVSSLEYSKCKLRAYEIAPRRPLNHIMNDILFVILVARNLLTIHVSGKILAARPIRHKVMLHNTSAKST